MKPGADFPYQGLGIGDTLGDKCVKAIKLMCKHAIQLETLDEASAIDGSRPLEQVADACGIAWGSTNVQMTADLSGFKVLAMVGKGFTPAQQAWPALTLEGFAQLGGKRAQRKLLGPMRSLNWTDHANFTKLQQIPNSITVGSTLTVWTRPQERCYRSKQQQPHANPVVKISIAKFAKESFAPTLGATRYRQIMDAADAMTRKPQTRKQNSS